MPVRPQRATKTCRECRRRKSRCDKQQPCSQCVSSNTPCEYEPQTPRKYQFVDQTLRLTGEDAVRPSSPFIQVPLDRIEALESRVDALQSLVKSLTHSEPRPSIGSLRSQGESVRFVDPVHWAMLCRETADLDNILQAQSQVVDEPEEYDAGFTDRVILDRLQQQYQPGDQEVFKRDVCDRLIEQYFYGCFPLVPLVHRPTFQRRYEELWSSKASFGFQALVFALLCAGALSANASPAIYHRMALKCLRLSNFPRRPTLDTLRAYLICQSLPMKIEEPLTSVAFIGLSLRVANILGLQHDPTHYGLDSIESEERRRTWWTLVHFDLLFAVAAGLPPLIQDVGDVHPLSEAKESGTGISTAGILVVTKQLFSLAQRRFLRKPVDKREFDELGSQLESARSRIQDEPESYENNTVLNRWARALISVWNDQRFFMCLQNSDWPGLYYQTVNASLSFLIRCADLSADDEYQRFQWSWPGYHQPIHAFIIVLNDLLGPGVCMELARNVLDVLFALSGPQGGLVGGLERPLVQGGAEVWAYVRRLRAKAWNVHKWDDVSMSREEAIVYLQKELMPMLEKLDEAKQSEVEVDGYLDMIRPGFDWQDLEIEGLLGELS